MFTTRVLSLWQTPDRKTRSRPGSIVMSSESTMPLPPKVGSCLMQSTESLKGVGGVPPPPPKPGKLPVKQQIYDGSVYILVYDILWEINFSFETDHRAIWIHITYLGNAWLSFFVKRYSSQIQWNYFCSTGLGTMPYRPRPRRTTHLRYHITCLLPWCHHYNSRSQIHQHCLISLKVLICIIISDQGICFILVKSSRNTDKRPLTYFSNNVMTIFFKTLE